MTIDVSASERLVLQALLECQGEVGKPVSDVLVSDQTALRLEDARDILQILQEKEMVSLVITQKGLVSFIEGRGRLALRQFYASSTLTRISETTEPELVRVAVAGLAGTGKSMLINRLLNQNIMNVISIFPGTIEIQRHRAQINQHQVELIDCPGLGSGQRSDAIYFDSYKTLLSECHVLLWTVRADTKVVSLDEHYFGELLIAASPKRARVYIVMNYCDRMQPGSWDSANQRPDEEQTKSIDLRLTYLSGVLQIPPNVILKCSALYDFGIDNLRSLITA
jgi:predicted GTPase